MKHSILFKIMLIIVIAITFQKLSNAQAECTNLLEPLNQSTNVNISTNLTWAPANGAYGYLLRVGTFSGGGDIMDNIDVGGVTTYDPGDFPCASTIYVTILPYDANGYTPCDQEFFETEYVNAEAGWDGNICPGGSVLLNASGGVAYSWEPAGSLDNPYVYNPIASPIETTVYWVTVTNSSGCWGTDYATVFVNPNPTVNASKTDVTCYGCIDGTATANPSGGTPSYWYNWSTGEQTQSIYGLAPGEYTVTVGDIFECFSEETVYIYEYECPELIIEEEIGLSCPDQCSGYIGIYNIIDGVPPYIYEWSTGESSSGIYSKCAGNYSVTVTDSKNCTVDKYFYIGNYSSITPFASATNESCFGCNNGTATATPEGGTPPYWFHWSTDENTQTISNLSPGFYTVTVGDINECFSVETVEVEAFICPELVIEETMGGSCFDLCTGHISIYNIINGVPPFTYLWSNGETTSSIYYLCPGNYYVTVTDAANCTVLKDFDIVEYSQVIANESSTDESCYSCNNGTATVNPTGGTPGYWYQWSNGESTQTISDLAPGLYTVTVGDPNECSVVETVTINAFECPEMVIEEDRYDVSCYDECDGSIYINAVTNTIGTLMYEWSDGSNDSYLIDLCPGSYSVTITDVSMNCNVSETYIITEPSQLMATVSKTDESCVGCQDGSATANPSGGTIEYWYVWSNGEYTQTINNLAPGTYMVTVGDAHECIIEESIIINEFGCPEMIIQEDLYEVSCFGECDGYITITNVTNSIGTLMYQWNNGSNESELTGLCPGNYSVTVTDISNNCSITKSYVITQPSQLTNIMNKTNESCSGCNDGTATATPSGGTPNYWYQWSNGESTQTINNLSPGTYTVTVGDAHECIVEESFSIEAFGCPDMVIEENIKSVVCFGKCDGSVAITNVTNTIGTLTYLWSDGSNGSQLTGLCPGSYSVTVTDITNNCSVTKSYAITESTEILISVAEKINPTGSNKGKIDINTNNDGTYTFSWSGPNGYSASTKDINNLDEGCYTIIIANDHDCSKDTTICIEKETGILESTYFTNKIKLFPNPTNDYIIVDLGQSTIQKGLIEVYDLSGQKIITHNIDSKNIRIDLSTVKQGVYFAKIRNSEYLVYKKIMISK